MWEKKLTNIIIHDQNIDSGLIDLLTACAGVEVLIPIINMSSSIFLASEGGANNFPEGDLKPPTLFVHRQSMPSGHRFPVRPQAHMPSVAAPLEASAHADDEMGGNKGAGRSGADRCLRSDVRTGERPT
jgi:hypothetical protein